MTFPKNVAESPTTRLRPLKIGDAWHYSVEGSMAGSRPTRAVNGIIEVSIAPDSLSETPGAFLLKFLQALQVIRPDGTLESLPFPPALFSFVQDATTGDALIVADNMGQVGSRRLAKVPQLFYPGRWSSGTNYANRLEFEGGEFVSNTLAVVGQERLETPSGTYLSWVAEISSENSAMGRITGIDWWTPELGAPVRFETKTETPDNTRMKLRATLSSTNVAPDYAT